MFINAGKQYIVSTGGEAGSFTCGSGTASNSTSDANFVTFLENYNSSAMVGVDFDIEGQQIGQAQIQALVARVKVAQKKYPNLRFSFTIPTLAPSKNGSATATDLGAGSSDPLGAPGNSGHMVMAALQDPVYGLAQGTYFVNLMTMYYGAATYSNCVVQGGNGAVCDMGQSAIQAAMDFHNFYSVPYSQIEITPDIGPAGTPAAQNAISFLADVVTMSTWARNSGLGGVHFWDFNLDTGLLFNNAVTTNYLGKH